MLNVTEKIKKILTFNKFTATAINSQMLLILADSEEVVLRFSKEGWDFCKIEGHYFIAEEATEGEKWSSYREFFNDHGYHNLNNIFIKIPLEIKEKLYSLSNIKRFADIVLKNDIIIECTDGFIDYKLTILKHFGGKIFENAANKIQLPFDKCTVNKYLKTILTTNKPTPLYEIASYCKNEQWDYLGYF